MKYITFLLAIVFYSCSSDSAVSSDKEDNIIEYETAYDSINALIKAKPDKASLYVYRSELRQNDKEFELALGDLDRAIEVDSLNDNWYVLKSELLFDLKRFKESKDVLDNAIFKAPGSVPLILKKSEMYLITGDLQQCVSWANAALDFDVYNAEAYYLKGMAHKFGKDTVKAVTSFQTAVEQDINHYEAYMQLASLYAAEQHALAPSYYTNAIRIDSSSTEAYYGRGLYYQNSEKADKAMADYQSILDIDSNHVQAHYNMGYVKLLMLEEMDTAEVLFNKAFALDSTYLNALYMVGYSMELNGRSLDAEKTYREVLKLDPTHLLAAKGLNRLE